MSKHQVIPLHHLLDQGVMNHNLPGLSVIWVSQEHNNFLLLYLLVLEMIRVFPQHLLQGDISRLVVDDVTDGDWIGKIWQWWKVH